MKTIKILSLLLLTLISTSNCAQEEEDADPKLVSLAISPTSPVVIDADYSIPLYRDDTGAMVYKEIQAPWFLVSTAFDNQSDLPVTIVALRATTYGEDENGSVVVTTTDIGPADLFENNDPDQANNRKFLLHFEPHSNVSRNPAITDPADPNYFARMDGAYFWSLPPGRKAANISLAKPKISYSVTLEAIGWFGTPDIPEKSFIKRTTFTAKQ